MEIYLSDYLRLKDIAKAKEMIVEAEQSGNFEEEFIRDYAGYYLETVVSNVYDLRVEIAYNGTAEALDYYVSLFCRGENLCAEIGFYLSDYWNESHKCFRRIYREERI